MAENLTALYLRLSRDDGTVADSESIVNQKLFLLEYAKAHSLNVIGVFSDEHVIIGTSGENLVKSRVSALVPFSFLLRDKPKSFKSLKIISERI